MGQTYYSYLFTHTFHWQRKANAACLTPNLWCVTASQKTESITVALFKNIYGIVYF